MVDEQPKKKVLISDFNGKVRKKMAKLPEQIKDNVYRNQSGVVDPITIKKQIVMVLGAGSVGSNTLVALQKFGIDAFIVYDPDVLSIHNTASSPYPYNTVKRHVERRNEGYYNIELGKSDTPFKVSAMYQLMKNVPQLYWNAKPLRYGYPARENSTEFMRNCESFGGTSVYLKNGLNEHGGDNLTERYMYDHPRPSIMISTIDNIEGRIRGAMYLRNKFKDDGYPIAFIDSGIANALEGQVFCFNLYNDEKMLNWVNFFLSEPYESLADLQADLNGDIDQIPFLRLNTEACGNKMSIISSQMASTIITAMIKGLFENELESGEPPDEPNFDNVPDKYMFSFKNYYATPFVRVKKNALVNQED